MIEQIRTKYPSPRPAKAGVTHGYCVGGAFMLSVGAWSCEPAYPSPCELAEALREENPYLSEMDAYLAACDITTHNDESRFDNAWERLNRALRTSSVAAQNDQDSSAWAELTHILEGGLL